MFLLMKMTAMVMGKKGLNLGGGYLSIRIRILSENMHIT